MTLARRGGQGAPLSLILAVVFPAMTAAAFALAYYGYRWVEDVSSRYADFIVQASRATALRATELVEANIDTEARALFSQVQLGETTPDETCAVAVKPDGAVESYVVLAARKAGEKADHEICSEGTKRRWASYRLDLGSLAHPGSFRYMHGRFENGAQALVAFMRKQRANTGDTYYVAARFRDSFLRQQLADAFSKVADERKKISIVDEQGRHVAGDPPTEPRSAAAARFLYEGSLGKTLYAWNVQIAPADVEALQAQAARQRVVGPLLVALATVIIIVGLVIVWLAVRVERRASSLKSEFIANVSHELKTPLSLIRMFGEMIATGRHKGEDAAKEYGGIITRESERLSHLIDNVLDFARLERGKASYDFAEGDVTDLLERALDVCRYRLDKEKMRLRIEVEPHLPLVRMDENAMTLVILNLVDNAIKYAADGGQVDVHLGRTPGGVVLAVRDHGPGIPEEEQRRIFERFYRARAARDRNVRGSGIGLALVDAIVRAHGGRVTVASPAPGGGGAHPGCEFRVYLPAPIAEGSESAARHYVSRSSVRMVGPTGSEGGGSS